MAQVQINNIIVQNNPAPILSPVQFEISLECFQNLPGTFDWRIIYLGSPNDSQFDQVIDEFDMNQLTPGYMSFNTDSNPPDFSKIPTQEILGTSAILISVLYEGQEFFRVGYYVVNEYADQTIDPPPQLQFDRIQRRIMADNPRIMRFQIQWAKQQGSSNTNPQLLQNSIEVMGGDPFASSNGALEQLEKVNYSYGMFGPGSEQSHQ